MPKHDCGFDGQNGKIFTVCMCYPAAAWVGGGHMILLVVDLRAIGCTVVCFEMILEFLGIVTIFDVTHKHSDNKLLLKNHQLLVWQILTPWVSYFMNLFI